MRARLEKDIFSPNFAEKAPPEVVAECRAKLDQAEAQAYLARRWLADLG